MTVERAKKSELRDFLGFLVKLIVVVLLFRIFVAAPFTIPSESMLPRLVVGDYLLVSKWNYGFSRSSLPVDLPIHGRMFPQTPEPGDIVVFKAPPGNDQDYIKRVVALAGDTVEMRAGQLIINGIAIARSQLADYEQPETPNSPCYADEFRRRSTDGAIVCRYPRFRETLANGRSYDTIDMFEDSFGDTAGPFVVPNGYMFLMGDNRDNSQDSRFAARKNGAIGMVPQANLVGRAWVMVFSTDGSAQWMLPWTWFSATRWHRIGRGF